jgi:hypothetical protein
MKLKWTKDSDGEGYYAYGSASWYSIRYIITMDPGWFLSMQDKDGAEWLRTLREAKASAQKDMMNSTQ